MPEIDDEVFEYVPAKPKVADDEEETFEYIPAKAKPQDSGDDEVFEYIPANPPKPTAYGPTNKQLGNYGPTQEQLGIRSETAPKGPTLQQLQAPIPLPGIKPSAVPGLTEPKQPEPVDQGLVGQGLKKLGLEPPKPLVTAAEGLRDAADWMQEGMEFGPGRVMRGAEQAFDPKSKPMDERLKGGADVIGGTMDTLRPLAPAIAQQAVQTPIRVGAELATGRYGPDLFEKHVAKPLGLGPGATELGREAVAAAPLAGSVQRGMGALAERVVPKDTLLREKLAAGRTEATAVPGPEVKPGEPKPDSLTPPPEMEGTSVNELTVGQTFGTPSGQVTVTKVSPKGWIDFTIEGQEGQGTLKPKRFAEWIQSGAKLEGLKLKSRPKAVEPVAPEVVPEATITEAPATVEPTVESAPASLEAQLEALKAENTQLQQGGKAAVSKISTEPQGTLSGDEYNQAVDVARSKGKVSTSVLQRELKMGYGKAAAFLNQMEADGIIGPTVEGTSFREVLGTKQKPSVSQARLDSQSGKIPLPSRQQVTKSLDDLATSIKTAATPVAENLARGYHKFNNEWLNENHILWQLQKLEKDVNLSPKESIAVGAESFSGQTGKVLEFLYRTRDAMKPYLDIWDEAKEYGKMERHAERGSVLVTAKDGSIIPYKLEGGISLEENARRMVEFNRTKTPAERQRVKEALTVYRAAHNELFQMLRDNGLISEEFYNQSKKYNEYYMPFHRLEYVMKELDKTGKGPPDRIKTGSSAFNMPKSDFAHVAKGSEKEILDPMQSLIRNAYRTFYAVERNRVASLLVDYAERGNPGVILLEHPDTGMRMAQVPKGWDTISYLRNGKKRQVAVQADVAAAMKKLNTEQLDSVTRALNAQARMLRVGVTLSPLFQMTNMPRDFFTAAMVTGLDPISWAGGFIGAMARDIPTDSVPKWMESIGISNKIYRSFLKSGGSFGGAYQLSTLPETSKMMTGGKLFKIGKKEFGPKLGPEAYGFTEALRNPLMAPIKAPFAALHWTGETAELASRLAVFEHSQKTKAKTKLGRGLQAITGASHPEDPMSEFEAGWVARNATVNFAVRGAAMKTFSAAMPFFNAGIQASRITVGHAARNKKLTALRAGLYIGLPTLYTTYNNQINYADEYKDLDPEFLRDNLTFIYGHGRDKETGMPNQVASIRMDGTSAALYNALRSGLDGWKDNDPKGWAKSAAQLMNDNSPIKFLREGKFSKEALFSSVTPPVGTAAYSVLAGKDLYSGRDLTAKPGVNKGASPSEQYNIDAKAPMVAASRGLKNYLGVEVSPHVLENVPRNLFGHLGADAVKSMPSVGGKPWTNEIRVNPFNRIRYIQPPERAELRAMEQARDNRQANIYREAQIKFKESKSIGDFAANGLMQLYSDMKLKYPNEPGEQLMNDIKTVGKKLIEAKAKGMTKIEQDLHFRSNEIKAQYLLSEMKKDPNSITKLGERWKAIGLWGPKLGEVLQQEKEKQDQLRAAPLRK